MSCLEVFPTIDEDSLCHEFAVEQGDLRLAISVQQYEGAVLIRLSKADFAEPLFEMSMRACLLIRHTPPTDDTPEFLEFITSYRQTGNALAAVGVRISIQPQIRISVL